MTPLVLSTIHLMGLTLTKYTAVAAFFTGWHFPYHVELLAS